MTKLYLKTLILLSLSLVAKPIFANDGYFLCTPPTSLIDQSLGITNGTLNYSGLGVTDLVKGVASKNEAHYALNFTQYPYFVEVHHKNSLFQSGFQVYKKRQLKFINQIMGSHSGAALYRTIDDLNPWNTVSESRRVISDHLLPKELVNTARGSIFTLVGRRVAVIRTKEINSKFSFCIKQNNQNESFTEDRIRHAYMQLMADYRKKKGADKPYQYKAFEFQENQHTPLELDDRVSMINILNRHLQNPNYVFKSQYGSFLTAGALLVASAFTMKLIMKANPAMALLPPSVVDDYLNLGKVELYFPQDSSISFSELEELIKNNELDTLIEKMDENPRLEAYLRSVVSVLHYQTYDPNSI